MKYKAQATVTFEVEIEDDGENAIIDQLFEQAELELGSIQKSFLEYELNLSPFKSEFQG